jgi:hypothetical protein
VSVMRLAGTPSRAHGMCIAPGTGGAARTNRTNNLAHGAMCASVRFGRGKSAWRLEFLEGGEDPDGAGLVSVWLRASTSCA